MRNSRARSDLRSSSNERLLRIPSSLRNFGEGCAVIDVPRSERTMSPCRSNSLDLAISSWEVRAEWSVGA